MGLPTLPWTGTASEGSAGELTLETSIQEHSGRRPQRVQRPKVCSTLIRALSFHFYLGSRKSRDLALDLLFL